MAYPWEPRFQAGRDIAFGNGDEYLIDYAAKLLGLGSTLRTALHSSKRAFRGARNFDSQLEKLQQIRTWLDGDEERYTFWLHGPPKAGKSAIACMINEEYDNKGSFMASVHLSREYVSPVEILVGTIALQLAERCVAFKSLLFRALLYYESNSSKTQEDQWNAFVIQPLSRLEAGSFQAPFIIVIDALDACQNTGDVGLILRLLSCFRYWGRLRPRVFITSRAAPPDQDHQIITSKITAPFDNALLQHTQDALTGIRRKHGLSEKWQGDSAICCIALKAQRQRFLAIDYADYVCELLDERGTVLGPEWLSNILSEDISALDDFLAAEVDTLDSSVLTARLVARTRAELRVHITQHERANRRHSYKSNSLQFALAPESTTSVGVHAGSSGAWLGSPVRTSTASISSAFFRNSSEAWLESPIRTSTADFFVALLVKDNELRSICINDIGDRNVGPDKLARDLRLLLNQYLRDLSEEAETLAQLIATELFKSKSQLQRIAKKVCRTVSDDSDRSAIVKEFPSRDANTQRYSDEQSRLHGEGDIENPSDAKDEDILSDATSSDNDQDVEAALLHDFDLQSVSTFLSNSRAFQIFKQNLRNIGFQPFMSELDSISERVLNRMDASSDVSIAKLQSVIAQLRSVDPASISVPGLQPSVVDNWKYRIEQLSGTTWDWWPLRDPVYPLLPGQVYLQWQCGCGARRRAQVPAWVGDKLSQVSNLFSRRSGTVLPTSTQNDPEQEPRNNAGISSSSLNISTPGSSSLTKNTPSKRSSYVFLGVNCGDENMVAEIDVHGLGDDMFFKELRVQYYKKKGCLRRFFSIWRYKHCDFVKFEKFDHDSSVPRGEGMPEHDPEYQYVPKPRKSTDPMPPIHPHEFETRFYSCYGGGQRHKHIVASCNKVCRPDNDALERIPKRTKALKDGIPKRGYFWGLHARENISFLMVATYNFLLLVLPFVFWICWLFVWNHPGDLQNAFIPTSVVATLLPLFWFPLFAGKIHP